MQQSGLTFPYSQMIPCRRCGKGSVSKAERTARLGLSPLSVTGFLSPPP